MQNYQDAHLLYQPAVDPWQSPSARRRLSSHPLYLQVRNVIAQRITSGEWKPRMTIPSESELAREFNVSVGTMRKALDVAVSDRLLTRRQGRGTFVNDHSSTEHASRYTNIRNPEDSHVRGEVTIVSIIETSVNETEVIRLRMRPKERIHRIRRVWASQGKPYMLEDLAMPARLFPGLISPEDASLHIAPLAQKVGLLLGRHDERISIDKAAPDIAEVLKTDTGTPLLRLDRIVYSLQDVPVEWRLAQCLLEDRYYLAQYR